MFNRLIKYVYKLIDKADKSYTQKKAKTKVDNLNEYKSYLLDLQASYEKPMGFNEPIQVLDSIEVLCRCKNCKTEWYETRHNVYATKNSAWEYDKCSKCINLNKIDPTIDFKSIIDKKAK